MHNAIVVPPQGIYPLGGAVNGIDQMSAHGDPKNELAGGTKVTISAPRAAVVTTWGGHYQKTEVHVVTVEGKNGFYLASGFA